MNIYSFVIYVVVASSSIPFINCADNHINDGLMEFYGVPVEYEPKSYTAISSATVSMNCKLDKDSNVNNMIDIINKIMNENADTRLIVFGETILGWYFHPRLTEDYQRNLAETQDGATFQKLSKIALEKNIYLAYGFVEYEDDLLYNSLMLINPRGEKQAVHRKNYIIGWDWDSGFNPGKSIEITEIDGVSTLLMICADYKSKDFFEAVQNEEFKMIIHSTAFNGNFNFDPDITSRRYNAWNICANRVGDERIGEEGDVYHFGSFIADPTGTIRAGSAGDPIREEGYAYFKIKIAE